MLREEPQKQGPQNLYVRIIKAHKKTAILLGGFEEFRQTPRWAFILLPSWASDACSSWLCAHAGHLGQSGICSIFRDSIKTICWVLQVWIFEKKNSGIPSMSTISCTFFLGFHSNLGDSVKIACWMLQKIPGICRIFVGFWENIS